MKYSETGYRTRYYVDGNTVRKIETVPARSSRRVQAQPERRKKQQEKAAPMNIGYMSVMAAAVLTVCLVLMAYVKLQSDITNHVSNISKLESQLYELQLSNDEYYTKIMSNVDLDEIKRIAITELGMKYAKEGQVIDYTSEGSDYVRQFSVIPSE